MMPTPRGLISIIIPTLNEQSGIQKTISSIPKSKLYNGLGYDVEILVIDNKSTDLTREVALKMGARVILEKEKGYGRAYKTGFAAARGDIIVTLDGDGTYPAELIPEYIQLLNERNADFITINRFSNLEEGAMSFIRKVGNKILALLMSLLYSVDVKDSQSGMWIMKRSFITTIRLNSDDMSMSEEIKIIAFKFFKSFEIDGKYYKRIGIDKLNLLEHGWKNFCYLFLYLVLLAEPAKIIFESKSFKGTASKIFYVPKQLILNVPSAHNTGQTGNHNIKK
jgi:dolichol-phosphate hexosyltransferase